MSCIMAEQACFDMGRLKRLAQKSVLPKIELRGAEIVRRAEMAFIALPIRNAANGTSPSLGRQIIENLSPYHSVSGAPAPYLLGNRYQEPIGKYLAFKLSVVL